MTEKERGAVRELIKAARALVALVSHFEPDSNMWRRRSALVEAITKVEPFAAPRAGVTVELDITPSEWARVEKLANDMHACPQDVALAVFQAGLRKMEEP